MEKITDASQLLLKDLLSQNEMLKTQLIDAAMINELVKVLHSCTDLEGIVKTVLLSFQDLVHFDRAILFTINGGKFRLEPWNWVGIDDDTAKRLSIPLGFDGGDITDAIFLNRHIFVEEPDPASDIFSLELQSPSYIVAPLLRKPTRKCWEIKRCTKKSCSSYGSANPYCWSNLDVSCGDSSSTEDDRRRRCLACAAFKAEGIFWLDRKNSVQPITSGDISNLTNIITLAGLVFENFRMINALDAANHELISTNETLRKVNHDLEFAEAKIRLDLEQARQIQQKLLPQDISSSHESYKISSRYLAANTVGGDYYDVFKIADGTYGIVVADVSGHGIASALVMSMAKTLLRVYSKDETSPQKTLERINDIFVSEVATEHFVTIFYAVLDVNKKKLRFSSAGHCPIFYLHKDSGKCDMLKADGLFLGVFPDIMLAEREIDYVPEKQRLILYTDGLTEAINPATEMYGTERLTRIARETTDFSTEETLEAILEHQVKFCDGVQPEDDITLLVMDF
ncbi:MAG: serine/threonine-protein phosphatase [Chitinispirillales bacterium]|jgi:serine phosphatase RsbU (regulator of sigma subunit)|nr:serine/threonine-protein phosphatase [Chitinispirillales bacterium]